MDEFKPYALGGYFLLAKIARGGMAEIFVAADARKLPEVEKIVIKRLLQEFSDDKRFVSMLIDEAKITSILEHPNIVKIHDVGSIGRDFYLSLEYVEGISLDRLIEESYKRKKRIPLSIVTFLADRVGKALDYAHNFKDSEGRSLNLVHRDVTPGNVLLSFEGEIKLADFGIATASRETGISRGEAALGKKFYMPPEQLKNLPVDRKTDIYALGAVIYEILTGHKIFDVKSEIELQQMIISEQVKPPSFHNPSAKVFDETILKALAKNPKDRPDNAIAFVEELAQIKPFDSKEHDNLKLFLWELFSDYKISLENRIESSIKAMHEYDWEADKPKMSANITDPQSAEKTEFVTHDYKESQTSMMPKEDVKTVPPDKIEKEITSDPKSKAPIVKIQTKKVSPDELKEIRKKEIDEMQEEGGLHQDENMTFILPPNAKKDKAEDKKKIPDEKKPTEPPTPPPDEDSMEKIEPLPIEKVEPEKPKMPEKPQEISDHGEDFKLDLPDKVTDQKKEEDSYDLGREISKEKKRIVRKKKLSSAAQQLLISLILIIVIASAAFVAYTYLRNYSASGQSPKMTKFNPTISIILFTDKPGKYERKILPRMLSTKKNDRFDNFGTMEDFIKKEYKRYTGKSMDFLDLSFIGPIVADSPPPLKMEFWNRNNIMEHFKKLTGEEKIKLKDHNVKIFVYFYKKNPEDPPKYPIIYKGPLEERTQIVFLPMIKEEINSSIILLTSRILAAFGATEKLDRNLNPQFPDGLAEPTRQPVYPQRYAEIMARYIPESADGVRLAASLSDNRIGPKTAYEIGWIDKATYEKLSGIR